MFPFLSNFDTRSDFRFENTSGYFGPRLLVGHKLQVTSNDEINETPGDIEHSRIAPLPLPNFSRNTWYTLVRQRWIEDHLERAPEQLNRNYSITQLRNAHKS